MLHNTRREAVSRPFRRHKSVRPLKRKRLTLIAAFRCGTPDDPSVVVCADSQETHGPYLVEVKTIQPRDAGDEAIYKHQVKQFYRPNRSLAQTVLLGIDLISIGIKTSNYIGGPIQVIVARKEGVWADYPEDVKRLEERIERFNEELGRFALACLDVSMPDADFDKVLARFQKQIVLLRRTTAEEASVEHTKRQVREARKSTEDDWQGFPYPKYSFEAVVDLLYGRERIQRAMQEARDAVKEEEAAEIQRNEARARLKRLPKSLRGRSNGLKFQASESLAYQRATLQSISMTTSLKIRKRTKANAATSFSPN